MRAALQEAIETELTKSRNRADMVRGSLETVGGGLPDTLKIYKIGCSEFWYARAWINGLTGDNHACRKIYLTPAKGR